MTEEHLMIAGRLFLSLLLGGLIGWEREYHNKQAGFKTHVLVTVSSCLIMLISIYGFAELDDHPNVRFDPARLAAQAISGIGFLAGGAILVRPDLIVSGLTTAATLWMVMAIGLGVGTGFYFASILATLMVLLTTMALPRIEARLMPNSSRQKMLRVRLEDSPGQLGKIASILGNEGCTIKNIVLHEEKKRKHTVLITLVEISVVIPSGKERLVLSDMLRTVEGVLEIEWE